MPRTRGGATPRQPTVADVATAARVSTATVSRVLNGNETVAPELAARVQLAMADLGYRPSRVARSLRTRRARVWFLILSDIQNTFFTDLVGSIQDRAHDEGYALVVCNSQNGKREQECLDLAIAEQAAGVIIVPIHPRRTDVSPVLERGVPVVSVDQRLADRGVDCVVADNVAGARLAVDHLFDRGYKRVAFLGGVKGLSTASERLRGYRQALKARAVGDDPALARVANFNEPGGYREMQELLALARRPDAVIAGNNPVTIGALHALKEAGVKIPTDIGLIGFDETIWATLVEPPLTTIAQPTWAMGHESAQLLLSRIDGYVGPPRRVVLPPSLHVRESTRPR